MKAILCGSTASFAGLCTLATGVARRLFRPEMSDPKVYSSKLFRRRRSQPRFDSSPRPSARAVCLVGAGSGRTLWYFVLLKLMRKLSGPAISGGNLGCSIIVRGAFALTMAAALVLPIAAKAGKAGGGSTNKGLTTGAGTTKGAGSGRPSTASGSDAGKSPQGGSPPSTASGSDAGKGRPTTASGSDAGKGAKSVFNGKNPAGIVKQSQKLRTQ